MNPSVTTTEIPLNSEISRHLYGAHFHDCYQLPVEINARSALELYLDVVSRTPAWVNYLMVLRNTAVMWMGLKNLGHLGAVSHVKPADAYRVGDRVSIFSVLYLTDSEVILGDSDKHLNVQVSVLKLTHDGHSSMVVSTVVHIHNLLGRIYMLVVAPIHKLIVPAMLGRAHGISNRT
jgi:Protein of unknown function (DUF2867)